MGNFASLDAAAVAGKRVVLRTDLNVPTRDGVITDLTRIENSYVQQYGSEPSPAQMRTMVDNTVREEIYLREALALGLDKNDEIVRRRLAQPQGMILHAPVLQLPFRDGAPVDPRRRPARRRGCGHA